MKLVTQRVSPDEPAWSLFEGSCQVPQPDGATPHRWVQDIVVTRHDRLAHYVLDLGPAEDFEGVTPIYMPSMNEETVGRLQDYAERNRHDRYWAQRSQEMLAESTLIRDHVALLEMQLEYRRRNPRTVKEITR